MTKYGSPELEITVSTKDLHPYITDIGNFNIEALTEEGHTFGDDWVKHLFTGIKKGNDLTLSGFYDDETDGPDDVLSNVGSTVPVVIKWGGTKMSSFDALIKSYSRNPSRGELTKFSSTLVPTGEVTEDS